MTPETTNLPPEATLRDVDPIQTCLICGREMTGDDQVCLKCQAEEDKGESKREEK